jgi:hypothetical protein
LNRIELWRNDNNMLTNCNNTKCMTVGTMQKLAFQNEELSLTINFKQLHHSFCNLRMRFSASLEQFPQTTQQ